MILVEKEERVSRPADIVERELSSDFGEPVERRETQRVWTRTFRPTAVLPSYTVMATFNRDSGHIQTRISAPDTVRSLGVLLILMLPGFLVVQAVFGDADVIGLLHVPTLFVYLMYLGLLVEGERELNHVDDGVLTGWRYTPFLPATFIALVVISWSLFRFGVLQLPSQSITDAALLLILGLILLHAFMLNAIPGVTGGPGARMLVIPLAAIGWITVALVFFYAVVLLVGLSSQVVLTPSGPQISAFTFPLSVLAVNGIIIMIVLAVKSDLLEKFDKLKIVNVWLFGSLAVLLLGSVFDAEMIYAVSVPAVVVLGVGAVWAGVWLMGIPRVLDGIAMNLLRTQLTSFQSPSVQYVTVLGFVAANATLFAGVFVAAAILLYGLTGGFPAPVSVFVASVGADVQVLEMTYLTLDLFFSVFPLFTARTYTIGFLALLTAPVLTLTVLWMYSLTSNLVAKATVLVQGERRRYRGDNVSVELLVLADDEHVVLRPVAFLFGRWQFVVVSQAVLDLLESQEVEAVLAHELYHLENRDLVVNAAASLFSVLFGGRNALLAFYDYPRVEQEADRYAADMVGTRPLITAIRRLENRQALLKPVSVGTPGFTRIPQQMGQPVHSGFASVKRSLRVIYALFFGRMLLDAAHRDGRERIRLLVEDRSRRHPERQGV